MPIVKANEPLPERPVIILLFGDPGSGKTSIANTCNNVVLVDADNGVDRSILRKDTLKLASWEELQTEEQKGTFNNYNTIALDTPKALLDDFLKSYVIRKDYKLKTNKLGMFGAIGDEFSMFVSNRQAFKSDLFIVCHSKKDEDTKLMIPDVTGGSYQLLLRKADQVGYLTIRNGQRVIVFEPNDFSVGKNTARFPDILVPAMGSPELEHFGAMLIEKTKQSIASMSEEQKEALEASRLMQEKIEKCGKPSDLDKILVEVNKLPDHLKLPLKKFMNEKAQKNSWTYDKDKGFIAHDPAKQNGTAAQQPNPEETTLQPEGEIKTESQPQLQGEAPEAQNGNAVGDEEVSPASQASLDAFNKMMEDTKDDVGEVVPKGVARFKKKYDKVETIEAVLNDAKNNQHLAELYFNNDALVEGTPGMKEKFSAKRNAIQGQGTLV